MCDIDGLTAVFTDGNAAAAEQYVHLPMMIFGASVYEFAQQATNYAFVTAISDHFGAPVEDVFISKMSPFMQAVCNFTVR